MAKRKIVLTGGGSAGHVTPNIAIINEIRKDWDIAYIGSKKGIEKELIGKMNIPYHEISSGKLRRYVDFENVVDLFRVMKGCVEARRKLKRLKPDLVFSKGGFVSVPVILAAKSLGIPIFIHESDMTPGLANKISQRFATKIYTSFEETKKFFPKNKTMAIGSPIRRDILMGSMEKGRRFLEFHSGKPILTVMGGSLGAKKINEAVRAALPHLSATYQIVHLCGKDNVDSTYSSTPGYKQFEYVHEELPDILAATDIVITRGGSNSIFEFLALKIPMLIIPLSLQQSRGDQIVNAKAFEKEGFSLTLAEENLTSDSLISCVAEVQQKSEAIRSKMSLSQQTNGLQVLVNEMNKMMI